MRDMIRMAVVAATLAVTACSTPVTPIVDGPDGGEVRVESIEVFPSVVQFASVGDSKKLITWFHPAEATDREVTWESSNPAVASVDADGLVTAVTQGPEVTITATAKDGGHQSTVRVRVGGLPQVGDLPLSPYSRD